MERAGHNGIGPAGLSEGRLAGVGAQGRELLRSLGPGRILALGLVALAMMGFFAFVAFRAVEPPFTLLFAGLDSNDANTIVRRLEGAGVPYRLGANGDAILVHAGDALRWRMALAEDGLPTGSTVGNELFDRTNSLTTTDFLADVSLRRALEGELARTIGSLRPIRSARVHLVEPKRDLFRRVGDQASASIVLSLVGGGGLDRRQLDGIRHLVAGAVPGLDPAAVSVIDDRGNLLSHAREAALGSSLDDLEDHRMAFEQRIRDKITQLLERTVGSGRVEVEVAADFDFSELETTSESYDPNGQVARSTQTVEESTDRSELQPDTSVSVANSLPTERTGNGANGRSDERTKRTDETSNFEVSRTMKTERRRAPALRHLSLAVQVDGLYRTNADGSTSFEPRGEQELTQLEGLVRSAAGIDESRGDVVRVVSRQFVVDPPPTETVTDLLGVSREAWWRLADLAGLALVTAAMLLFGVRPAIRRLLPPLPAPANAEPSQAPATSPEATPAGAAVDGTDPAPPMADGRPPVERLTQLRQIQGRVRTSLIDEINGAIESQPGDAVRVIRNWLHGT